MMQKLLPAIFALLLPLCAYSAQTVAIAPPQQQKSLADIARENKNKKPQATITITEESKEVAAPVLPDISSDGLDNSDEILKAIDDYRARHTPQETETAIHGWYDKHDVMLQKAIEENKRIEERQKDRESGLYSYDDSYTNPGDLEQYRQLRRAELLSERDDLRRKKQNSFLSARIQQNFMKVRGGIARYGMKFEWFKIRCGNGNCSF